MCRRICAGLGISTKVIPVERQTERLLELLNKRATVGWRAAPGRVIGCHLRFIFPHFLSAIRHDIRRPIYDRCAAQIPFSAVTLSNITVPTQKMVGTWSETLRLDWKEKTLTRKNPSTPCILRLSAVH